MHDLHESPATSPRADLAGLAFPGFAAWCRGLVGHSDRFHRALYRQVTHHGRFAPAELPEWQEAERQRPGVVARLQLAAAEVQHPPVSVSHEAEDASLGTTVKILIRLADGRKVESVVIPMQGAIRGERKTSPKGEREAFPKGNASGPGHHTVCISSQVGCRMGCRFCHTAKMGLIRNLTAAEMVGQVLAARSHTGIEPRNVVFMGMGEPLDNLDQVAAAVAVLTDVNGFAMAYRHITISTVGRVDGIARLPTLGLHRVNLAISLTAADDALRSELMPVNRLYNLAALKTALCAFPLARDRRLLISYVLIAGVNDTAAHAAALVEWMRGLPVLVNLIPFNRIPDSAYRTPDEATIIAFRDALESAGASVRLRLTKGAAVMAACGQLGDPGVRARERAAVNAGR